MRLHIKGIALAIFLMLLGGVKAFGGGMSGEQWWRGFNDPLLDSLVTRGMDNNYNLAIAAKRISIARNAINSARAGWYPQISVDAGWSRDRTSGVTTREKIPAMTNQEFDLGASMSWEIDLFGKIYSGVRGKEAQYKATKAEYDAAMLSLAGQIADAYMGLRMYQAQLALAREHCVQQQKVVTITEARHEAGIGNALEVAQARGVLYSTEATIPSLQNSVKSSINAIAVLLGVYPSDLTDMLEPAAPIPEFAYLVPKSIPMELLRSRPDVVEAERQIDAYAAELGVARKAYLPSLTLNGSVGTQSRAFDNLFTDDSFTYTIAPTLSWTLFDGFARKNNVASARTQMEMGIDNYNQTLITAVQEADNALSAYSSTMEQIQKLQQVVDQNRRSFDLSLDLYKQGLAAFTNVVDAQIDLLQYANSLIAAKAQAANSIVSIYEAIGGAQFTE